MMLVTAKGSPSLVIQAISSPSRALVNEQTFSPCRPRRGGYLAGNRIGKWDDVPAMVQKLIVKVRDNYATAMAS
jgi:hypothetical protein